MTLGGSAREQEQLYQLGKNDVKRLATETGEKARLIVERNGYGITLYQATGENVDETITHVGSREDLYCTAAGKAFLAELSDEELDSYLSERDFKQYTDRTITDSEELRTELEKIRTDGVAFDDGEFYQGLRCVAAPIVVSDGGLLGAFSVSAPVERMGDHRFKTKLPDQLQNIVGVVEINTTYSKWTK